MSHAKKFVTLSLPLPAGVAWAPVHRDRLALQKWTAVGFKSMASLIESFVRSEHADLAALDADQTRKHHNAFEQAMTYVVGATPRQKTLDEHPNAFILHILAKRTQIDAPLALQHLGQLGGLRHDVFEEAAKDFHAEWHRFLLVGTRVFLRVCF